MKRIMTIGRHFKVSVLSYDLEQKLVTGGFQTEVTFESHKDSERKGNRNKVGAWCIWFHELTRQIVI